MKDSVEKTSIKFFPHLGHLFLLFTLSLPSSLYSFFLLFFSSSFYLTALISLISFCLFLTPISLFPWFFSFLLLAPFSPHLFSSSAPFHLFPPFSFSSFFHFSPLILSSFLLSSSRYVQLFGTILCEFTLSRVVKFT